MLPHPTSTATHRQPGLDTLRALAILLVLAYHYMVFVSGEATFGWFSDVGWVGVDLFFVLSGYLIGRPLLVGLLIDKRLPLLRFYARRAFRTLPLFWVVLACFWALPQFMGGRTPPPLWRFLTFTQNWGLQPGTAFSHAWSLCVEEQFYLTLPLALLLIGRSRSPARAAWCAIAGGILMDIVTRSWLWQGHALEAHDEALAYFPRIYYATLARADEFLPGVAIALLQTAHPALWARVARHGQRILLAGLVATLLMMVGVINAWYINGYGYGFFMTAFGYSLIAASFALLVLAALSPASWLNRYRVPGAETLALWSYAIYLSHKPVAHIVKTALASHDAPSAAVLATVAVSCLTVGWALHRFIEQPAMRLGQRWMPPKLAGHETTARQPAAMCA